MSALSEAFTEVAKKAVLGQAFMGASFAGAAAVVAAGALVGTAFGSTALGTALSRIESDGLGQITFTPLGAADLEKIAGRVIDKHINTKDLTDEQRQAAKDYLLSEAMRDFDATQGARAMTKKITRLAGGPELKDVIYRHSDEFRRKTVRKNGQDVANIVAAGSEQPTKAPTTARFRRKPATVVS